MDPLLQRSLTWSRSCKGLWLWSTPLAFQCLGAPRPTEDLAQVYSQRFQTHAQTHRGPGSSLFLLRSQTHAWPCRDLWFPPTPSELPVSLPDPQGTWLSPSSSEVLGSCPDPQGFWIRSTLLKVPDSCLDPQQFLALCLFPCTCSCGVSCLWCTLAQVAGSILVHQCP